MQLLQLVSFVAVEDEETNIETVDVDPTAANRIEASRVSGQDLKIMMKGFLDQLPWLINRDLIDKAALDFVTNLNTKNNRRKLCQSGFLIEFLL